MKEEQVFSMPLAKVYPLLEQKALRKGRTKEEVLTVIQWLTGYTPEDILRLQEEGITYGEFFRKAPAMNPARKLIGGSICGVKLENIENPLMQDIRYLDKLIDELAKGKALEKILRTPSQDNNG